ncbi:BisC Anaerobic dehydrogenases, typically selenocysteine-containing [Comamonadaceae bacterium]
MAMVKETQSTCPYCGVGCGVIIQSTGNQITGVKGDPQHPANFGRLCSKGSTLHLTATAEVTLQTRLLQPLQRLQRGATPEPVTWDSALHTATTKFAQVIRDHGPDAVGFYVSGQLLTEDYYVFNKLAKGLIGTNNIDTNSRLCMSSAVAGYKKTLGADSPPASYEDLGLASTLFIAGSNAAYAHPILFRRIEDAKAANPELKIVVVDVRRTDTAEAADLFLQIQPGTDVMLFNGMLHLMLWEGWTDAAYIAAHTEGFDALKALVRDCTPDAVAAVCGIRKAELMEATRLFAQSTATLSLYCMGLNQSSAGTAKNTALINLHLATGQIGKPGAGPFSLTGQPNAMGGREVGGLANLLSAHRDLANPDHRAEVAALWGVPAVPEKPGKTAIEMFQAAADGEIKALWIACTNPAQSLPDQATVRRALERAEFVVLQEAFATTATARYADLLLPATTWGEKEGTVTNSERRISRVRAAVAAPGPQDNGPRHDWAIAVDFAQRLESALGRTPALPTLFPYPTPESVWNEHRESTRGRDLDITGMSYAQLEATPLQWPMPEGTTSGKVRLYEDGVFPTPTGRARFVAAPYTPVAEQREARYPFALTTGRLRDQWHGMSRTGTLGRLFGHVREPALHMHPQDMARRLITEGDLVHITSKRGSILAPVQASTEVGLSQVFLPMHWGDEFLSGQSSTGERLGGVNALTSPVFCPDSKQPELKHAAVKVLKSDMPWGVTALAWLPADQVLARRTELQALMARFEFASCVLFGNDAALGQAGRTGVMFRAAGSAPPDDALLAQIEALLDLQGQDAVRYADPKRGQRRVVRLQRSTVNATLEGFLLSGDTQARDWMAALLREEQPAQNYGRALLAGGAQPPLPVLSKGKTVCTCFNVSDIAISDTLSRCTGSDAERLGQLQKALQCGTNCGSCIPQLQRMVKATPMATVPAGA